MSTELDHPPQAVQAEQYSAQPIESSPQTTATQADDDTVIPPQVSAHVQQLLRALPASLFGPSPSQVDSLTCQWSGCGERAANPEALYDHVCDRHIGRKSTNNLNLTCAWGLCRITTVKRDHITSHMRVHVPLKPHKCGFCNKCFKRPQDLKKHVKTHADDSAAMQSPDNMQHNSHHVINNGFAQDNAAFYQGQDLGLHSYPAAAPSQQNGGYFGQQYPGYGQAGFQHGSLADQQTMDTRRRAVEALNDFLGDIKRRSLNPKNYYDVGQRLNTQALPLPVSVGAGYSLGGQFSNNNAGQYQNNGIMDTYGGAPTHDGGPDAALHGPFAHNYALPMSNARTKTDLQDIDRFLEQLQATVYDSNPINPAVREPKYPQFSHAQHMDGHSPMSHHISSAQPLATVAQMASMAVPHQGHDTPALTPASISSHTSSAHSPPQSNASHSSIDASAMYPQLPSVPGISDVANAYASAPPPQLASTYEPFDGRRYHGGRLQRQAPSSDVQQAVADADMVEMNEHDGGKTPQKLEDIELKVEEPHDAIVDPALQTSPPAEAESDVTDDATARPLSETSESDPAHEAWMENVRIIETLRGWIKGRLEQGTFHESDLAVPQQLDTDMVLDAENDPSESHLSQALKHSLQQEEANAVPLHEQQAESHLDPELDSDLIASDVLTEEGSVQMHPAGSDHVGDMNEESVSYPNLESTA